MSLKNVVAGTNVPHEINVIIEISAHSDPVKYEVEKESGVLMVDRFLSTPMHYPCNYGFIPDTLCDDGDPADVLVITPFPVISGSIITCRPVGMLIMEDESGEDNKIIAVPTSKITHVYDDIKEPKDLPLPKLDLIEHFFSNYKALEKDKWVKVNGWKSTAESKQFIVESVESYKATEASKS